jgi:hypothetical protein
VNTGGKIYLYLQYSDLKKFFDFFAAAQEKSASAEKNGLRLSTLRYANARKEIFRYS